MIRATFLIIYFGFAANSTNALSCYQCNTLHNFDCDSKVVKTIKFQVENRCNISVNTCFKAVLKYDEPRIIYRGCGTYNQYDLSVTSFPGLTPLREDICTSHMCNSGVRTKLTVIALLLNVIILLI